MKSGPQSNFIFFVKRLFDIVCAGLCLVILSPLLALIALLIKIDSKGPVLFRQERVGRHGKIFIINKFRTMVVGAVDMTGSYKVEAEDRRITRIGTLLRQFSLDELPQLVNIIKGEMSIVGPRPTLVYQVERYDDRQRQRLLVRPGVTGWAQVNGRNAISWPERIELDLWYIERWTMWLDLKILLLTFKSILFSNNLYRTADYDPISDPDCSINKENGER